MARFKVGDKVRHDFSGTRGKVLAVCKDKDGYTTKVKWLGIKAWWTGLGPDWYKEDVLSVR